LVSKAVAWLGAALLNGKKPFGAAAAVDGGVTVVGVADPAFGRGVGSGTSCATAEAATHTIHAIAKIIVRAPRPVILFCSRIFARTL
jgi:hypothetical protein